MVKPNFNCWGVIIDTDQYTGNFERELCAFCTGIIGECSVGKEFIPDNLKENNIFEDSVAQALDENGVYRPVSIYPGVDKQYNSLVIFFKHNPTAEQIEEIKKRALQFKYKDMQIKGFRLTQFLLTQTSPINI